jgi:hypothetical protein
VPHLTAALRVRSHARRAISAPTARHFRLTLTYERVVQVLLNVPLPDIGDLGVIDLHFVMYLIDAMGGSRTDEERKEDCRCGRG